MKDREMERNSGQVLSPHKFLTSGITTASYCIYVHSPPIGLRNIAVVQEAVFIRERDTAGTEENGT